MEHFLINYNPQTKLWHWVFNHTHVFFIDHLVMQFVDLLKGHLTEEINLYSLALLIMSELK